MRARILTTLLLVSFLLSATTASVSAAEGFNLTLSPLPVSLVTKPGQPISTPIRIQNSGTQAVRLKVTLMKFKANGTSGEPAIIDPQPNDDSVNWVRFSQTNFIAQPGVFNSINMIISPPKSAAFGYYYAVVFSQDNKDQPKVPSQNKVNGAVASLILLNVDTAGEKRTLSVDSLTASRKLYQYLPADFTVAVKNSGNIHVVPTGNIFIHRSGSNDFISTLKVNQEAGNVLPNSARKFTAQWNDGFPRYIVKRQNGQIISNKDGSPKTELSWRLQDLNNIRFGRYTASLTMIYNDGERDKSINGDVSFWVIPWLPLLIILVLVILVGLGLYVVFKTVAKRFKKAKS